MIETLFGSLIVALLALLLGFEIRSQRELAKYGERISHINGELNKIWHEL